MNIENSTFQSFTYFFFYQHTKQFSKIWQKNN